LTARLLPEALQFSWRSDHDLVAAVRRGEDSAFEQLFARYRTRIWTYASRILGDADRAEDVTQEVFISVLRRLGNTERPIAFKPWVYQIAKNACIDELRRTRHSHEVPFDHEREVENRTEEVFSSAPGPDVAIESKQQLEDLRGAFRGVSDLHRRILVLRELEGLSYSEIGNQLGMSRPVVESTLFRARRRLAEEYEELMSGRRCQSTRAVIDGSEGRTLRRLGVRETRQMSRHLSHCEPCRRHAVLAQGAGVLAAGALVLRKSAGEMPARPVERPIALASRRRPAADDAAIASSGSDSLAVA
jgi:RNA polymerase sigma factor (sigma-70 family)